MQTRSSRACAVEPSWLLCRSGRYSRTPTATAFLYKTCRCLRQDGRHRISTEKGCVSFVPVPVLATQNTFLRIRIHDCKVNDRLRTRGMYSLLWLSHTFPNVVIWEGNQSALQDAITARPCWEIWGFFLRFCSVRTQKSISSCLTDVYRC